jgi:peroxiredoxin
MTLQQKLDDYQAGASARSSPEPRRLMQRAIDQLKAAGIEGRAPGRGQRAPDFELPDANGGKVRLAGRLELGAVVLVFYRGGWCPYCNLTLREWLLRQGELREAGAGIVAVSPESPDHGLETLRKNGIDFPVLSDAGNRVAAAYGLVFRLDDELVALYRDHGVDLARINGEDQARLPMPGVFLIEPRGSIVLAHVDADYRRRLEPDVVLEALRRPAG